jgi:transposase
MVERGQLSDTAWASIAPLLPSGGRPGRPWADHRKVIDRILWKVRTGAPWRDLPERYGPWQTCYEPFVRWRGDGTWERLLAHVQSESDAVCDVLVEVSVDSTVVRAHQHAAETRCLPSATDAKRGHHIRRTRHSDVVGAA